MRPDWSGLLETPALVLRPSAGGADARDADTGEPLGVVRVEQLRTGWLARLWPSRRWLAREGPDESLVFWWRRRRWGWLDRRLDVYDALDELVGSVLLPNNGEVVLVDALGVDIGAAEAGECVGVRSATDRGELARFWREPDGVGLVFAASAGVPPEQMLLVAAAADRLGV